MITEIISHTWDHIRCTWETKGDNIKLAWEVRSGKVPSLKDLEESVGAQIRSLPDVGLSSLQSGRLKPQIMSAISASPRV